MLKAPYDGESSLDPASERLTLDAEKMELESIYGLLKAFQSQ